jgi:hypothetical protein
MSISAIKEKELEGQNDEVQEATALGILFDCSFLHVSSSYGCE